MNKITGKIKGTSIIEILIVVSIIGIAFFAILSLTAAALKSSILVKETNQATFLAQEAIEAVISFRNETDWSTDGIGNLNTGSAYPYYPQLDTLVSPPKWNLLEGQETTGIFNRKIVFEDVSRDLTTGDIENIYNPFHNDADTKKVTTTVSWGNKKVDLFNYLTNWK
ncbi:MAG: hypothetical protein COU98_02090 [Candidatus Staskawiczbacteria bacterium CG10_big_fil_rev_8_21_14_0_10_38_10]|uniref:Type II secretion system protein n=1 Tax=Candidatus Staskawiczbacteria bacterium CG10_big_fil_rev_8_21_14_0_10_38_10 TaxID=1974891 RepID=A0A2H9T188_9BACT|nr:MAG: hypothetical protein COU98_02090 [Candidatus Staskawiczbacteria bacterium CG10_big_fil_rev_8_21_14_0_10_38_10]